MNWIRFHPRISLALAGLVVALFLVGGWWAWYYMTSTGFRRGLPWNARNVQEQYLDMFPDPGYYYLLKARINKDQFDAYTRKFGLAPVSGLPRSTDDEIYGDWSSFGGAPLTWWDPPSGIEGVFALRSPRETTLARYHDGHLYVKAWAE